MDNTLNTVYDFVVRMWVKREDYWGVKFDLTRAIKESFDEAGIEISFPQTVIHQGKAAWSYQPEDK